MIQIESAIDFELALPLEDYFCELELSHWSLVQKTDNDAYRLFGYFDTEHDALKHWFDLQNLFPKLSKNPELKSLIDEDWQNAYKKYLKPWNYQNLHWIPIWEKENYPLLPEDTAVYLDAGMAFGTGAHETTQLCAKRLIDFYKTHKIKDQNNLNNLKVIDAGCGSGILAISARLLGFQNVMGFDNDPEAIRISKENAEFNGIYQQLSFKTACLEEVFPNEKADLILANILANVLCQYSGHLLNAINPGGSLVLSGILVDEIEKVKEHFCQEIALYWKNFHMQSQYLGEWADLRFDRG